MMDILDQSCRWHRRFAPPVALADGRQLLLSETETLLLPAGAVTELSSLLTSGTPLSHKLSDMPMSWVPALMATWRHLAQEGHVQDAQAHAEAPYVEPDFRQPITDAPQAAQWGWFWSLSAWPRAARLHERTDLLPPGWPATLVVCDDLLDPRLAQVADWHRIHQRPWLPMRLVGEQAMIGPLFDPSRAHAPCWHCLAFRLAQQQPGRCADQGPSDPPRAVPLRADPALFERRLLRAARRVQQAIDDADAFVRTWVDGEGGQRHRLIRRPTCPSCGDAGLQGRQQSRPLRLQSRTAAHHAPGGTRVQPPEHLLAHRETLVSTLLGPILELTPIHAAAADVLPVYRSRFARPFAADTADEAPSFFQICLGKGRTAAQSQASAMGEAIERLSAIYRGDEAIVLAAAADLGEAAVPAQRLQRVSSQHAHDGHRPPADMDDPKRPLRWTLGWSLTKDARRYLPLAACLRHAPPADREMIDWTSNGCAAGQCVEEAILQGLLELIERDATAIWWYGRWRRPALLPTHKTRQLAEALIQRLGPGGDAPEWHLLDLTHDLGIPVVAAVVRMQGQAGEPPQAAQQDTWALGFGCHLDEDIAAERALSEVAQLLAVGKTIRLQEGLPSDFLRPDPAVPPEPRHAHALSHPDLAELLRALVAHLDRHGLETIAVDLSRPDLPLHTVKVFVPGLCHIWPQSPWPSRMSTVPAALAWLTPSEGAAQWNPQALFV